MPLSILEKMCALSGCTMTYFLEDEDNQGGLRTAFRADCLSGMDLNVIATVDKIAINMRCMNELKAKYNS